MTGNLFDDAMSDAPVPEHVAQRMSELRIGWLFYCNPGMLRCDH